MAKGCVRAQAGQYRCNLLSDEEFGEWSRKPEGFLEGRYHGLAELAEEQGSDFGELVRMWGFTYWSIAKAKRVLGYAPHYNLPEFFKALKRGDRSHYPYADVPWWGETGDLGARLFEIAGGFTVRSTSRFVGEGVPGSSTRCAKSPRRPGPPDADCIGTAVIGSTRKSHSRVIVRPLPPAGTAAVEHSELIGPGAQYPAPIK